MSLLESFDPKFYDGNINKDFSECQNHDFFMSEQFNLDAKKIVKAIAQKLGFPVHKIEITLEQMYGAIEDALMEYTLIINDFRTKEEYFNLLGTKKSTDLSNKFIEQNIKNVIRISNEYALEAHVESGYNVRKGFINIEALKQEYNWKEEYFDLKHPNDTFEIRRVFHQDPPASLIGRNDGLYSDLTSSNWINGNLASTITSSYTVLPTSYDISRLMASKDAQKMRFSSLGFRQIGGKIYLTPKPQRNFKLYFEYTLGSETYDKVFTEDDGLIKSPSDVLFNALEWNEVSFAAKIWIIKMALALSKIQLGRNRSKYSSIVYSGGDINLDGDTLINEGIGEAETLRMDMREKFNELSYERGIEIKRNIAESTVQILNKIPILPVRG